MVRESWDEMKPNLNDNICVKGMLQLCSHAENDFDIYDHGRKITWNARNALKCASKNRSILWKDKKVRNYIKSLCVQKEKKFLKKQHFKKSDV